MDVMRSRRVAVFAFVAAFVAFCIVQDRATAAGARRYVELQRDAIAGAGPAVRMDEVMRPAVRASVRQGLAWAGLTGVVAYAGATLVARRITRA